MTLSGLFAPSAILLIGIADVFEAKIQCSGITASISFRTLCFTPISSNTATEIIKKIEITDMK